MAGRTSTVREFIAARCRVYANCVECGASTDADLAGIAEAKGASFALCDTHPPCKTPGCSYWVTFYANTGQVTTPLYTEAGLSRESDRRTEWLARGGSLRPNISRK